METKALVNITMETGNYKIVNYGRKN